MILFLISLFSCYWEWTLLRKYIPLTSKFIYNDTHPYISWPKFFFPSVFWMLSEWSVISLLLFVFFCVSSYHLFFIIIVLLSLPIPKYLTIVSPLQTNLQVASFQRCKCVYVFAYPTTSGVNEIAACPPSPIADDPSALLPPTSSPSSN